MLQNSKLSNFIKEKKLSIKLILVYNLANLIIAAVFYFILPIILNYPPDYVTRNFQLTGVLYHHQLMIILSLVDIIGSILLYIVLKDINLYIGSSAISSHKGSQLSPKYAYLPLFLYFVPIIGSIVITFLFFLAIKVPAIIIVKTLLLIFVAATLEANILLIISKNIIRKLLQKKFLSYSSSINYLSLKSRLPLQIIPLLVISVIFIALICYSRYIEEKSDLLYQIYHPELEKSLGNLPHEVNTDVLISRLEQLSKKVEAEEFFILTPTHKLITLKDTTFDKCFTYELYNALAANKDRIYGITSKTQGIVKIINNNRENWLVGIKYNVSSKLIITYLILSALILLLISIGFLIFITNDLVNDIRHVSINLHKIANRNSLMEHQKLPITSYDEIGDLIISFNQILDLDKEYISTVEELAIAKERNRFSRDVHDTLGQTITNLVGCLDLIRLYLYSSPQKAENYLDKATRTAKEGLTEVKKALSGFSGLTTDNTGLNFLIKQIESLIASYQSNKLKVEFNVFGPDSSIHLKISEAIYRVCQEALTNSVIHGKAHYIKIDLDISSDNIALSIINDGRGCQEIKKGRGLSGMEARVRELAGKINFSSDKTGFKISVNIPINESKSEPLINI